MLKVVTLDLDGVFFENVHSNLIENLSKKLGISEDILKQVLFVKAANEGGYNDLKCGKITSEQYWTWLFKELGVFGKFTKEDYLSTLLEGYKINTQGVELIKKLRNKGIKTAICSNNYKDNIDTLENNYNLSKYFDFMIFSYEVGVLKPDRKIYQALISKANVLPAEILYIDDKEDKLITAKELGMKTLVYTGIESLVKKLNSLGVTL